ncbi:MAG: hypothetical protein AAFV29_20830, partial [Myxococcota bacterium]
MHAASSSPSDLDARLASSVAPRSVPHLSFRDGLQRYRKDRKQLFVDLGDDRVDIAVTKLGPLRVFFVTEATLANEVLVKNNDAFGKGPAVANHLTLMLG